ncbi:MAG: alanine--tRNA ligase-related protein [archaeon]
MDRKTLIKKYIEFFKSKDHKEIPNASLVPENDPTVLFTTAGMQPLVPFFLGQKHPLGKRLVNVQKCIRTVDIDEVGDTFHHTFFEMLGNWSIGDYWKEGAIEMTFEFFNKKLGLPIKRLAVTCFKGDKRADKDTESEEIWIKLGIAKERIVFLGDDNWWGPAGKTGPCGPSTEIFYWKPNNKPAPKEFNPKDENWVEIGNDVLIQFSKDEAGNYNPAKQKIIDFGGGTERIIATLNGLEDNYLADMWKPIIKSIEKLSNKKYKENEKAMRIIADHIKASCFMIADGISPSNMEQGYVLRRLIRRAIRYARKLNLKNFTKQIAEPVFEIFDDYEHLQKNKKHILDELEKEENKFLETLEKGIIILEKIFREKEPINKNKFSELMNNPNKADLIGRIFDKKRQKRDYSLKKPKLSQNEIDKATITGKESFLLFQSYGFPLEMIDELAMAKGFLVSHNDFRKEQEKHQKLSRTATEGRFKSGLADSGEETTKLHTATHLLHAALRKVLGNKIQQKGSNITSERLRFDFTFDRKMTDKEKKQVEDIINKVIKDKLPVTKQEMSPAEAKKSNALGFFESKYGDKVSVYTVGDNKKPFSKEICAGPHVKNLSELKSFKIKKEESSSAGVRRIKATLK